MPAYGPHLTVLCVIRSGRLKGPAIDGELVLPPALSVRAPNILYALFLIVLHL